MHRIFLASALATVCTHAEASFVEQCVLAGTVSSEPVELDAPNIRRVTQSFDFLIRSSLTLYVSHRNCSHWEDKTIEVQVSDLVTRIEKDEDIVLQYIHVEGHCPEMSGQACQHEYYLIKRGSWPE